MPARDVKRANQRAGPPPVTERPPDQRQSPQGDGDGRSLQQPETPPDARPAGIDAMDEAQAGRMGEGLRGEQQTRGKNAAEFNADGSKAD